MNKNKGKLKVFFMLIIFFSFIISMIIVPTFSTKQEESNTNDNNIKTTIEKNCDCGITKAEIREYWDHDFVLDVTTKVNHKDGVYVSFNKYLILRLYFNKNLSTGDIIQIYAKFNTNPHIKNAYIEDANWHHIGGGEVYSQWKYYNLTITSSILPRNVLDISIDGSNPSSQKIMIDYVKCICVYSGIKNWYDNNTGEVITDYRLRLNYIAYADDVIDSNNIYLDLEINNRIVHQVNETLIMQTLIEHNTTKIPSLEEVHEYVTQIILVPLHSIINANNITIIIDVNASIIGLIKGSSEYAVLARQFTSLRSITLWWY